MCSITPALGFPRSTLTFHVGQLIRGRLCTLAFIPDQQSSSWYLREKIGFGVIVLVSVTFPSWLLFVDSPFCG